MGACAKLNKATGDCCKATGKCFRAIGKFFGETYKTITSYITNIIDKLLHSTAVHLVMIYLVNIFSVFFSLVYAFSAFDTRNEVRDDDNISDNTKNKISDLNLKIAFVFAITFLYRMLILFIVPCVSYYHDGGLFVYTSPKTLPRIIFALTLISAFLFAIFSYFIIDAYLELQKYYSERFLIWYFLGNSNELGAVFALIIVIFYQIHQGGKEAREENEAVVMEINNRGPPNRGPPNNQGNNA